MERLTIHMFPKKVDWLFKKFRKLNIWQKYLHVMEDKLIVWIPLHFLWRPCLYSGLSLQFENSHSITLNYIWSSIFRQFQTETVILHEEESWRGDIIIIISKDLFTSILFIATLASRLRVMLGFSPCRMF